MNDISNNFKLINIDGPDGVGKTTLVEHLVSYYTLSGKSVEYIHFPRYATPIGKIIQDALFNRTAMDPRSLQMLYSADRQIFTKFDLPSIMETRDILFTDRYLTAGLVFGQVYGVSPEDILLFDKLSYKPDLNLILLASPEKLIQRLTASGKELDKHETIENQRSAYEFYQTLSLHVSNIRFLDAENTKMQVLKQAVSVID